ncbi:hypothetical protein [Sulfurimonas sp. HSL3-7]|uniref:hypothetical protein n=1 Tax=Sulfonitrofixus jiaomeiensis TaxID=3131938 RepID=UPI0031F8262B
MGEPRLEELGDYNTLKGEKRRIFWAVIIAGLIIGTVYLAARSYFVPNDMIETQDEIVKVPRVK